ncbi:hypothetical protein FUAX_31800 [Fulvitalea axinellae]|uniref:SPOR domain-containing protein n=1 Tax=Fulvitalea axinellae TaxID=1182444 RepID=A0AAU9D464_9BACT|nr:hypothetical protein FUAX_31800 [Fulvitalea axinellae]
MRHKILFLCFLLAAFALSGVSQQAVAQEMSKKERKEWKRKLKKISPEQYKKFLDEFKALQAKSSEQNGQISSLEERLNSRNKDLQAKEAEVSQLLSQLDKYKNGEVKTETAVDEAPAKPAKNKNYTKGVTFRVQIGAFRNKDLSKYFDNTESFGGEINQDGTQQITLGVFRDYWNANTFKKYLREMGVKDAWIVAYKNNKRVPIKDVLEGVM